MKNKKWIVIVMAALMALAMVACGNEPAPTPTPDPTPTPNPEPAVKVDYSGSVTDWMYTPESEDALIKLLVPWIPQATAAPAPACSRPMRPLR